MPYPRRRRVDMMLRSARIAAESTEVPSPEAIRAEDRERLLERLLAPIETDEDQAIAAELLAGKSAGRSRSRFPAAPAAPRCPSPELIPTTPEAHRERAGAAGRRRLRGSGVVPAA
ncbi:hypothetical protein AB5I41_09935 [Sphingomonas sp. MMS24-JH45]